MPTIRLTLPLLLVCLIAGCAGESLRRTTDEAWFQRQQRSALTSTAISERTEQLLRRAGLSDQSAPQQIDALFGQMDGDPAPETCLALAELCYAEGKRGPPAKDARYLVSAMLFSYAHLFGDEPANPFDPGFRRACDVYNRSLARLIHWQQSNEHDWGTPVVLQHLRGTLRIAPRTIDLPWEPESGVSFEVAYRYESVGLVNYRASGLGVPVLAIRPPPGEDSPAHDRFRPAETPQAVPLTVLVRFDAPLRSALGESEDAAWADLSDPTKTAVTQIGATHVPLETDITTAVAYMLEHTPNKQPIEGVLNVAAWEGYSGLFMLQPYRRGRIPVVLVHGLLSTPKAWGNVVNEVLQDPVLRERYQIWYYRYPTGDPLLYSAAKLRESLQSIRTTLDPDGTDAALDQTVIIGRSLGGLLSKLQVQDSGERLWGSISGTPIEELQVGASEKELLNNVFNFKAVPSVSRAIFLVTPHRGAGLADAWFARFFATTVRLPDDLADGIAQVQKAVDRPLPPENAITALSPKSPILEVLAQTPIAEHVTYHSIMANREGPVPGGNDGIVPYESSHLDGAASEIVVQATHLGSTSRPRTILEVRRILHEHLGATLGQPETTVHGGALHRD